MLVSEGAINGLNVQAKKDLFVLGYGAITGSYQAGRDAGVVTYSTFNAGLRADRRVDYVYAAGSISGAITGDYAIGAPTNLAGPSGPFAAAGSDGVFTFGTMSATVNALNTSTAPEGGVILGVGAVGSITGTITASSLITRVHSGSTITPAPSAPTVGTITENDPSLQSLTAPTATPTDPTTLRADSTAARATLISERAAIDLFFTNYTDSLDATATDLTNQLTEQRAKLSDAVTAAQTKASESVGAEVISSGDAFDRASHEAQRHFDYVAQTAESVRHDLKRATTATEAVRTQHFIAAVVGGAREAQELGRRGQEISALRNASLVKSIQERASRNYRWGQKTGATSFASAFGDELKVMGAAGGNAVIDTGYGLVTLGLADPIEVFEIPKDHPNYQYYYVILRGAAEGGLALGTAGLSNASKVGHAVRLGAKGVQTLNTLGDAMSVSLGIGGIFRDGEINFKDVANLTAILGLVGDRISRGARTAIANELFADLKKIDLSSLSNREIGALGERIAKTLLGQNEFTDILSIQNRSGNGIDIIARASDGRLVFFEVKSSAIGRVGDLTNRQKHMSTFVEDVLSQASQGLGRYRTLDAATQDAARRLLRDFRSDPLGSSGIAIGIDLLNEIVRISPWK